METENTDKIIGILKGLGDTNRYHILRLLASSGNSLCVNAIAGKLSLSQPVVSQHLKVLKNADLVEATRAGNRIHYSVKTEMISLAIDKIKLLMGKKEQREDPQQQ